MKKDFWRPEDTPLVGQPYTLHGVVPTVIITCNCGESGSEKPIVVTAMPGQCKACGKLYILTACSLAGGQCTANMDIRVPAKPLEAARVVQ